MLLNCSFFDPALRLILRRGILYVLNQHKLQALNVWNYLNRAGWVIVMCYAIVAAVSYFSAGQKIKWKELIIVDSKHVGYLGVVLGLCLVALNILFR